MLNKFLRTIYLPFFGVHWLVWFMCSVFWVIQNLNTLDFRHQLAFLTQRAGLHCCWHAKVQHMFLRQFPLLLLLLLCTSHNKELTEIKTCCKQLKCTLYFTRTSGRPESGALLCGCNLNAVSVNVSIDFITLQLQEKSACFYSYLFWEVDLNVKLLLSCTHTMELQYTYLL